ncbi:MAG: hypothetical protein EBU46_00275 [Nitrosomonadaceae bacterium]|nr:hypothetical protein [Nitrosomonadaceae bacterium]
MTNDPILTRYLHLERQKDHQRIVTKQWEAEFAMRVMDAIAKHPTVRQLNYETPLVLLPIPTTMLHQLEDNFDIDQRTGIGRFTNGVYFNCICDTNDVAVNVCPDGNIYDADNNHLSRKAYWFNEEAEKSNDDPPEPLVDWLQTFVTQLTNPLLVTNRKFQEAQKILELKFNNWEVEQRILLKEISKEINEYDAKQS